MPQTPSSSAFSTRSPAWQALQAHAAALQGRTLQQLFAADPQRAAGYTLEAAGWTCDWSKQHVTADTVRLLLALAQERGVAAHTEALFTGALVNTTEGRAALHTALRAPAEPALWADGVNITAEVQSTLARMGALAERVRSGEWRGFDGRPIRNIVNIGIGGSDLGPVMAAQALKAYSDRRLRLRFVSNVDPAEFHEATRDLDAAETLFIVCSKSFVSVETLVNAQAARRWCVARLGDERAVAQHFVAVSANPQKAQEFGIAPQHCYAMWDWVGGRYSMDSAIGLSTLIAIGPEHFRALLAGFHAMDVHFRTAPAASNLPLLHGLLAVWNTNFLGAESFAVLPYSHYLARLPAYLQQLMMESNGKRVRTDGSPVDYATSPVLWGEPGTNGQHSFYQLLHQGTRRVACDLIGFAQPLEADGRAQQDLLLANLIAQAQALAFGRSAEALRAQGCPAALVAHRACPGDRPSSTLLAPRLTPHALGALIALYEHSVFVQGAIWGIDSFDQWGVELGKQLAAGIVGELAADGAATAAHDSSTNALIRYYRAHAAPIACHKP